MNYKDLKFSRDTDRNFIGELRKRVSTYFEENNISKYANAHMVWKTIILISAYVAPYLLMVTGVITGTWPLLLTWMFMGAVMSGIGFSIMHDANHGAYSNKKWVNKLMGSSIYILAGNVYNWQVQHNVLKRNKSKRAIKPIHQNGLNLKISTND